MSRVHHHPDLFDDHRWAVGGAVALYVAATAVLLWMAVGRSTVQPIDDWWYDLMVDIEAGFLTSVAKTFNYVGSTWLTAPIRLIVTAGLWAQKRWEGLAVWIGSILVSELAVSLFKALYGRSRPLDALVGTSSSSFPSGHAIAGAVTAVALVIILLPAGAHRRIWEVAAGCFAFFMAMSRTYLRAHWLTDVVAGVLLGTATAIGVAAIVHVWWLKKGAASAPLRNG